MKKNKLLTTLAIISIVMFAGCKNDDYVAIDGGPCPVVISVTPVSGATLVGRSAVNASEQAARTTLVTATFNKKMDSRTINGSTFIVKVTGGAEVNGNVTYNAADSTAIFTASGKFADNTTYEARVTTGVKDPMGNTLQEDKVWPFSTGTTILPVITATSPADLAINVPFNQVITATFSVPMDPASIVTAFSLKKGVDVVPGLPPTTAGTVVSFTPTSPLSPLTVYTVKISTAAKNLDESAIAKDTTWTFTTADVIPAVITTDPLKGATNVLLNKTVSATFSVAMNGATITPSTFTLKNGSVNVTGVVGYAGTIATFNPNNDLLSNTLYTATIKAGVKNTNETPLAKDTVWTFRTETVLGPTVIFTSPVDGATNVALNKIVTATFSEAMDNSSITTSTYTIMEGLNPVVGVLSFSGNTASFSPNGGLVAGKTYTAKITKDVTNAGGTKMANDYVWSFSTSAVIINPPFVDLGMADRFGILAGVGVANDAGFSVIDGLDVGIYPGARSSVTGFPPATVINGGEIYAADDNATTAAMLLEAQNDLTAAYIFARDATAPAPQLAPADLGGKTLAPGIYYSTSSMLLQNGDLTLDAQGDANAFWIFKVGSAFTSVGGSPYPSISGGNVILTGGAKAKNVFWQVSSSATIGSYTSFKGNVLSLSDITMAPYAQVEGRMLARNGTVKLNSTNKITKPIN